MCDVVTVLETHNKQPEDSLQQNRYIYLLCVIMTPHTAYPVCDFSYKRCCINLMTKTCCRPARRCRAAEPQRLCPHGAPAPRGTELPAPGAGGCPCTLDLPPAPAGNAGRQLTAHRHQRTRRLVSPHQLLKHYTDDGGGSAYTGSENSEHPKVARKATVAAGECSKTV